MVFGPMRLLPREYWNLKAMPPARTVFFRSVLPNASDIVMPFQTPLTALLSISEDRSERASMAQLPLPVPRIALSLIVTLLNSN